MNKVIEKINEDINKIKVINYQEENITTNTNFLGLKTGEYQLNNGSIIKREGLTNKIVTGNAVCIFAVTLDKKILIVIQPRVQLPTNNKINIELPAGYIEEKETSIEAALRELTEETGYTSDNIALVDSYYSSIGHSSERIDLLLALECFKISDQQLDKDEFIYCEAINLEEFEYLLNNNYIMDANARIGYYRYLEYLMIEGY